MSEWARFLHDALLNGSVEMRGPPADGDDPHALAVLRSAYDGFSMTLAGPLLPMDESIALAAGRLLWRAAWFLVNPLEGIEQPEKVLAMPGPPRSPEQHLSADVTLRLLAGLHRRARATMHDDVLPAALEQVLRQWPLSGVLADLSEPPTTPIDFGEHPGLNLLYAERLADHERAGWHPQGVGMQYVELVWTELGKETKNLPMLTMEPNQEPCP
jgi:hypothetical protein